MKNFNFSGIPTPRSYVPSVEENPLSDRMTFVERFVNIRKSTEAIITHLYASRLITSVNPFLNKISDNPAFPRYFVEEYPRISLGLEISRKMPASYLSAPMNSSTCHVRFHRRSSTLGDWESLIRHRNLSIKSGNMNNFLFIDRFSDSLL